MSNFEVLNNLPYYDLWSEFVNLIDSGAIKWHPLNKDQICINTVPGYEDDIHLGRGSLHYDWDNNYKDESGKIIVPERQEKFKESDFSVLCNQFKGTGFDDVFSKVKRLYNIGRVRVMNLKPKTCLSWHKDTHPRIHYPLKTQEGCLMIIENETVHLKKHEWVWTDTTKYHTAINSSREERYHLVVSLG